MLGVSTFQNRHILTMLEEEEAVTNCHSIANHFITLFVAEVVFVFKKYGQGMYVPRHTSFWLQQGTNAKAHFHLS